MSAARRFLDALAARDFAALEACLAPDVRFRALVPNRLREHDTAPQAVARLRQWFGDADAFHMVKADLEEVGGRTHVAYRFRLHDAGGWSLIEQHAYLEIENDRIRTIDLVCSGFQPTEPPG